MRNPANVKPTWEELHNFIYRQHQKRLTEQKEIRYKDEILEIDGAAEGDLRIELPQNTHTLIDWGNALSHCVGSYGSMAAQKYCEIVGVFKNNEIKYCLELRGRRIVQFKGKHNCFPEPEDEMVVRRILCEKKVIDTV